MLDGLAAPVSPMLGSSQKKKKKFAELKRNFGDVLGKIPKEIVLYSFNGWRYGVTKGMREAAGYLGGEGGRSTRRGYLPNITAALCWGTSPPH